MDVQTIQSANIPGVSIKIPYNKERRWDALFCLIQLISGRNGPISVDGPKKDQKVGQIRLKNGPISIGGSKMDQKRGKHERENGPISVDGPKKDQNSGKVERIIGPISANPSGSDQRD